MHIRLMTMKDYDAVYALWAATPGIGLHAFEDSREGIAYYLQRNPATCFVAEEEGAILGVLLGGNDGRRGVLSHMAVRENFRRRGVGDALLTACQESLRAQGIRRCVLLAFLDNGLGNAFWASRGFTQRDDVAYWAKDLY